MSETRRASDTVLYLLGRMTADALDPVGLDAETRRLVRVAALVAVGAPPASYLQNLELIGEMDAEKVCGVLSAVAPIVGADRARTAIHNIVRALAVKVEVADLAEQNEVKGA